VYEFGSIRVEEDDITTFGRQFDPQSFHTDPDQARASVHGGLIASGWHTGSVAMRLLVDHFVSAVASIGSPGIDEVRWLKPVRPGDELSVRATILEARRSRSKPDRGIVTTLVEVMNQRRDIVMSWKGSGFYLCRTKNL
jgi:acyl dehydratase